MINLAIGTAQFGQNYGICNHHGAVKNEDAESIVAEALDNKIFFFDTASTYGDSEAILGRAVKDTHPGQGAKIVTKYYADPSNLNALTEDFENSIQKLGVENIQGVLIHNVEALLGDKGQNVWKRLRDIKERYDIQKIGVSVYTPDEFLKITELYEINLVQLPCSLLDQRFLNDDIQAIKKTQNIEVHARSLFLQGLLLCSPNELPDLFQNKKPVFQKLEKFLSANELSHMELCLLFARWAQEQKFIERWVIGVDSVAHLKDIIKTTKIIETKNPLNEAEIKALKTHDKDIIDPRLWGKDKK